MKANPRPPSPRSALVLSASSPLSPCPLRQRPRSSFPRPPLLYPSLLPSHSRNIDYVHEEAASLLGRAPARDRRRRPNVDAAADKVGRPSSSSIRLIALLLH